MKVRILHLSDLHFGYDGDATARTLREKVLEGLVKIAGEARPDVVAISGDLTWRGSAKGYELLADWLKEKLFPATRLTAADCVICAGNHDIVRDDVMEMQRPFGQTPWLTAESALRVERMGKGCWLGFPHYEEFARKMGIPPYEVMGKPSALVGTRMVKGVRFAGVNSAWYCRGDVDEKKLWLGLKLLEVMDLGEDSRYDAGPIVVALVHHPSGWLHDAETQGWDRTPAYGYLAERAHVVLSGHTHAMRRPPTRWEQRAWILVGGAGFDNSEYRNNFAVLDIDTARRSMSARIWEYDPRRKDWLEQPPHGDCDLRSIGNTVRRKVDAGKYLTWLRGQTRSMNVMELKGAPSDAAPPRIDALYMRLKVAGGRLAAGSPRLRAGLKGVVAGADGEAGRKPGRLADAGDMELTGVDGVEGAMGGASDLEAVLGDRKVVIEGKPGSGKTTFLRHLAWTLCQPGGPPPELPVQDRCPIFLRISLLDEFVAGRLQQKGRPAEEPVTATDPRWVATYLASQKEWGLDEEYWLTRLRDEGTLVLLDGLDEAADAPRRKNVAGMIQGLGEQFACRVVVTTRPDGRDDRAPLREFALQRIEDLDEEGVRWFVKEWSRWVKGEEGAAEEYAKGLREAVEEPGIRYLARNPLMLTTLAVLYGQQARLPQERAKLYEQVLEWLADKAAQRHKEYRPDDLLKQFGELALVMQEWKGGHKLQIGLDTAAARLVADEGPERERVRQMLERAQVDSGIVTLRGGEIAFWHRSFQEYLAARVLSGMNHKNLTARALRFLYAEEGREVLPLLAGRMVMTAREQLDDLLVELVEDAAGRSQVEERAHAVGVLGAMEEDVRPARYEVPGAVAPAYEKLRRSVMCIFDKGSGVALKTGWRRRRRWTGRASGGC